MTVVWALAIAAVALLIIANSLSALLRWHRGLRAMGGMASERLRGVLERERWSDSRIVLLSRVLVIVWLLCLSCGAGSIYALVTR